MHGPFAYKDPLSSDKIFIENIKVSNRLNLITRIHILVRLYIHIEKTIRGACENYGEKRETVYECRSCDTNQ